MQKHFVFTLTGADQIGIVERVTKVILEQAGNIEASKMAHLGGEFAMLMMIAVPSDNAEELQERLTAFQDDGYQILLCSTDAKYDQKFKGWLPFQIKVRGADHEGIVHRVTHELSSLGINIETLDTTIIAAPMSGTPLFSMTTVIVVPPGLARKTWQSRMDDLESEWNINIEASPYTG